MSDLQSGDSPKNGRQARVTTGHPAPTPFHVEIRADGELTEVRKFFEREEAERWTDRFNSERQN